jgi:hypothetical protein
MAMYNFGPPFREAKFCGVPSCASDELGCAAGEKKFAERWPKVLDQYDRILNCVA